MEITNREQGMLNFEDRQNDYSALIRIIGGSIG